jgi:hypothetical protein
LQFILSPLHPWAQAGKVEEAQIPRQNYILYEKTSYTFQMIQDYFRNRDQVLFTFMELGNAEAIKELVSLTSESASSHPGSHRKNSAKSLWWLSHSDEKSFCESGELFTGKTAA